MPLVAINSMEGPANLCNKARHLGDQTGTSPHRGALIRLEWLHTESTQLVTAGQQCKCRTGA